MPKPCFTVAGVFFRVLAAAVLGAAMAAVPAAVASGSTGTCAPSGKCFTVQVSPSPTATAGATVSFGFAITNEASTQQLGSVQITAPTGLVITGAPGASSFTSSTALFVSLSLGPKATTTLTVTAVLPCSGGSTYQWGIEAKQSNDFSGPPGNDFQLDSGNLSGTLTGSCSLAFKSQPSGTATGAVITSGFASAGSAIQVAVLDGAGQPITNQAAIGSVAVTIGIGSNPGSGVLSGVMPEYTSGGVASFPDLKISQQGIGYTLTATTKSPGFNPDPAPSADFTVFGSLNPCHGSSCSAKSSTPTTTGTVTTSSVASTDLLGTGIGGVSVNYSCGTYQPVSDPFSFDLFNPSGAAEQNAMFSASLDISKSAVQSSPNTGVSSWQICYASTSSFTAVAGTSGTAMIGGVRYFTGLLPDCSSTPPGAPCVQARKASGGDVIITFLATGDPLGKG